MFFFSGGEPWLFFWRVPRLGNLKAEWGFGKITRCFIRYGHVPCGRLQAMSGYLGLEIVAGEEVLFYFALFLYILLRCSSD